MPPPAWGLDGSEGGGLEGCFFYPPTQKRKEVMTGKDRQSFPEGGGPTYT